ncbi:hypothetical protein [Flavobacterium sp.]|jgi:hypothetical protein|uniref:hypothetical protein n=1 Tax=Flavobacterium sp. TaxID=239 RepID=UPI0037BF38E3
MNYKLIGIWFFYDFNFEIIPIVILKWSNPFKNFTMVYADRQYIEYNLLDSYILLIGITISLNGVKTKIPKTNAAVGIWNF